MKEVYNGNWRTFNRKRKHFSKWILAEIPVMLNQIRAKSVRHEAKTLWQPWTWLFRCYVNTQLSASCWKILQDDHLGDIIWSAPCWSSLRHSSSLFKASEHFTAKAEKRCLLFPFFRKQNRNLDPRLWGNYPSSETKNFATRLELAN